MSDVRPNQVWADNDPRADGRTLRIDQIDGDKAMCTVLTNTTEAQRHIDAGSASFQDTRGKTRRIALSRLRPTSTGYRLLADTPEATP